MMSLREKMMPATTGIVHAGQAKRQGGETKTSDEKYVNSEKLRLQWDLEEMKMKISARYIISSKPKQQNCLGNIKSSRW